MVFQCLKRAFSRCFFFTIFGIVVMGLSMTGGSGHAEKTVTTEYGDVYDCVDFYKQPAFDHPLLKDHSFYPEMRPTFQPQMVRNSNDYLEMNAARADINLLMDGGCPQGTVPIRRMNNSSGLSGTKIHPQQSSKAKNPNANIDYISGNLIAISQTRSDPSKQYSGVGAVISIYNPRVFASEYSSAEIILKGGSDSITAGWTVNPNKYKDNRTRFFIYAVAGNMSCFNSECGFVIVRTDLPLDFVLSPVSKRGDKIFVNKFFIYRDSTFGTWWLQVGVKNPITLGFWPQKIFSGLQSPATYAACGGEAYAVGTVPPPEMGSGYFPDWAPFKRGDAYCTEFVVVNQNNTIVDAADTETYGNNHHYAVFDKHMRSGEHVVTFGGPY